MGGPGSLRIIGAKCASSDMFVPVAVRAAGAREKDRVTCKLAFVHVTGGVVLKIGHAGPRSESRSRVEGKPAFAVMRPTHESSALLRAREA